MITRGRHAVVHPELLPAFVVEPQESEPEQVQPLDFDDQPSGDQPSQEASHPDDAQMVDPTGANVQQDSNELSSSESEGPDTNKLKNDLL